MSDSRRYRSILPIGKATSVANNSKQLLNGYCDAFPRFLGDTQSSNSIEESRKFDDTIEDTASHQNETANSNLAS
jgi:hypothetical protein